MTVEELAALVREYFASREAYSETDGGRWLNLKGAARQAHRKRALARHVRARDALHTALAQVAEPGAALEGVQP